MTGLTKRTPTKRVPLNPSSVKPLKKEETTVNNSEVVAPTSTNAGRLNTLTKRVEAPRRRQPQALMPKEVVTHETEATKEREQPIVQSEPSVRQEASEPTIPAPAEKPEPVLGRTTGEAEGHAKQTSIEMINRLSYEEMGVLWRELNAGRSAEFVTLRKNSDLPKRLVMRKDEAILREQITAKKPSKDALYCGYCANWMPFKAHNFTGYTKCCGCGMSTKDFYTSADNELFNK